MNTDKEKDELLAELLTFFFFNSLPLFLILLARSSGITRVQLWVPRKNRKSREGGTRGFFSSPALRFEIMEPAR